MAANPYLSKLEREKLNVQITEFFAKGNEVRQLGSSMRSDALPYVINPNKGFNGKKLPLFHKRK